MTEKNMAGKEASTLCHGDGTFSLTHGDAVQSKAMADDNGFSEGSCQGEGAPQSDAGVARQQRPRLGCRRFRPIVED